MKSFLFSVLHPTLARPEVAIKRCQEWFAKADRPAEVEYIFGLHTFETPANRQRLEEFAASQPHRVVLSTTPRRGSSSNWNQTAAAAYGHLLIQAQDDLAPPEGWDTQLIERLERHAGADWAGKPIFVTVSDGHRKDRLCITTIITRAYRDQRGFFLFPEYDGVYADDDSTAQAYDDAAAGRVQLIEARDIVFEHQHFTYPGGMSFDATYAAENSSASYKEGEALFARRHPRWHREQLCRTAPPMPNREAGAKAAPVVPAAPAPAPAKARSRDIIALMSAYNEGDIIYHVIGDLIENGVLVYLLDNGSTDNTAAEAGKWLGKGLLKIEKFPGEAAGFAARIGTEFILTEQMRRKEELSCELDAAWFLNVDADEFRESPWPGKTLAEAIRQVDALGYNAINFSLLNFRPTNDNFVPGEDVRQYLTAYQPGELFDAVQIKAWKNTGTRVQLANNGGHSTAFPGRRVFPLSFILRHYPIRGETHGRCKVFKERLPRFAKEEVAVNWHVQYNAIADGREQFLHDPAGLVSYDASRVRAELLGRFTEDILLTSLLNGTSLESSHVDGEAARAWIGRKLALPEPLSVKIGTQAEQLLAALLQALQEKKELPESTLDRSSKRLLLTLLEMKLAYARLTGDSHYACLATRLSQSLGGSASPLSAPVPVAKAASPAAGAPALVSLCIPTYNGQEFIAETIACALAQTYPALEIILSDDNSSDQTVPIAESLLQACRFPVRILRHDRLGLVGNWSHCIAQARGKYIKFLFQDDFLEPDCVAQLVARAEQDADIGLVFSPRRIERRDGGDNPALAAAHRDGLDLHKGWTRLALVQPGTALLRDSRLFQNPINKIGEPTTVLLAKAAVESVGGFDPNLKQLVDVEMWLRLMTRYKVGFVDRELSCFRLHGKQTTQTNVKAGLIAEDWKRFYGKLATDPVFAGLPAEHRAFARQMFVQLGGVPPVESAPAPEPAPAASDQAAFHQAMAEAETAIRQGQYAEAIRQTELALQLAPDAGRAARAREILAMIQEAAQNTAAPAEPAPSGDDFFGPSEFENIRQCIDAYVANPTDAAVFAPVAELQQSLAGFVRQAELSHLEKLFRGDFGQIYRRLLASGVQGESLRASGPEPAAPTSAAEGSAAQPAAPDVPALMADLLLQPAYRLQAPFAFEAIPAWFLEDYLACLLSAPGVFVQAGEAEQYAGYRLALLQAVHTRIKSRPADPLTMQVALPVATQANCIPLYCSRTNTRELMEKRAAIMEFVLRRKGAALEANLPKRPKHRPRIKVGYLNAHFGPQTETYVTLPTLQLDRTRFEICLFALQPNPGEVENRCRALADSFTVLPEALDQQVRTVRDAALDILIVGTNITAVTNQVSLLALHRLAPVQLASYCSPTTTGMRHMDGFLSGTQLELDRAARHYSERLHLCEGAPGCLDYAVEPASAPRHFDRKNAGIAEHDVVFVNAASCFKILPELQETWARILQAVPHSRLLLLPFNPNWANEFPVKQFTRTMEEALRRHGVAPDRLILSGPLPSRADVKALERLADVYLDTFPFSGSLSVIDPLELGLPTAVWQGETPRSRAAAALLRELKLPELIADNEADYVRLAVRLGTDPDWRKAVGERIHAAMRAGPVFLDAPEYGRRLGRLLETLVPGRRAPAAERQLVEV